MSGHESVLFQLFSVWFRVIPWPGCSFSLLLAPESERFLRGPVRIAEEDRVGVHGKLVENPRRHDEDIVGRELDARLADPGTAAPLDYTEYRAVVLRYGLPENPAGSHCMHTAIVANGWPPVPGSA